ncbi:uncharacterized protein LOC130438386 isoform X2 [Triplophysa dalaica]|uniref:uncharacterized protein LOC130438386 isoform X2 n=1 Tax=Triplophysa dalaica TaxID=1582913 RepID=UPI0024E0209B|nr:uncharacterized protein LOC130438386 isoform X2 [Triplophysa dalaica]
MLLMFGLMLLMFQMISCEDQMCRFNQTEICYAVLGHKLSLQMVLDPQHYEATLKHHKTGDKTVDPTCKIKNDTIKENTCDLYKSRSDVMIINGTVIINHVIREDSGRYTLVLTDSTGSETSAELQMNVEAPIGSVKVSVDCRSGERRVFCSSDGDELIFSWTLNGLPHSDGNDTIVLDDETSGNISCGVKNHVSRGEKSITLNYCTESTTVSVTSALTNSTLVSAYDLQDGLIVLGCVTVILLVLFITVYHIYKRKKHHKSTAASQAGVDLIYADINHMKPNREHQEKTAAVDVEYAAVGHQTNRKQRKEKKERKEKRDEELQYGEVTFTPTGSNIQQQRRCEEQDGCVYSQIQTHKQKQ